MILLDAQKKEIRRLEQENMRLRNAPDAARRETILKQRR